MKILHYTLGFPPERTGGLVQYALDIMKEQVKHDQSVAVLFPGNRSFCGEKMSIRKVPQNIDGIGAFALINSLPLPLFGGISDPKAFMAHSDIKVFHDFLKLLHPDVIHIHTLMGLPLEFFVAAKQLKIKMIFTTHDYFGLAAEPNFFYLGKSYDEDNTSLNWKLASADAYSVRKLYLFQSKFYPLIKKVAKVFNLKKASGNTTGLQNTVPVTEYSSLKTYYQEIFSRIDYFHFNSSVSKDVYENNLGFKVSGRVLTITDSLIKEHPLKNRKINTNKIKVAYIGPNLDYKGFGDYVKLSNEMDQRYFEFHTFGYVPNKKLENIVQHGRYKTSQLRDVYSDIDVLIVPSKWKETFGLVVLEALYNSTSVFVSQNVGAKDLLDNWYVYNSLSDLKLKLSEFKRVSFSSMDFKTIDMHVNELLDLYRTLSGSEN